MKKITIAAAVLFACANVYADDMEAARDNAEKAIEAINIQEIVRQANEFAREASEEHIQTAAAAQAPKKAMTPQELTAFALRRNDELSRFKTDAEFAAERVDTLAQLADRLLSSDDADPSFQFTVRNVFGDIKRLQDQAVALNIDLWQIAIAAKPDQPLNTVAVAMDKTAKDTQAMLERGEMRTIGMKLQMLCNVKPDTLGSSCLSEVQSFDSLANDILNSVSQLSTDTAIIVKKSK